MPSIDITFLDGNYVVDFNYRITYKGDKGSGPDSYYGPEPPSPMEFDIEVYGISGYDLTTNDYEELELPKWLRNAIEFSLMENPYSYEQLYNIIDDDYRN